MGHKSLQPTVLVLAAMLSAALLPQMANAQEQPAGQVAQSIITKAAAPEKENNGTDPTRPIRTASVQFEHLDLRGGFTSEILTFNYTQPLGAGRSSLKVEMPFSSVDVFGNRSLGAGDLSLKYTQIPVITKTHGIVLAAEMVFNTAARPELGTGKNVFKPQFIYAWFLKGGSIFAPALVHNISLWGDSNRQQVNQTTVDLYYVPHLANPKLYMTLDPAFNIDWENKKQFGALAVTLGYRLGGMFGGKGQVFIKPSTTFFDDRPTNWGIKVGFQVLGF
jgi:hypothetical protein